MNMDDFLNDPIEYNKEIRNRIRLSVAAYAYEMRNESIMDDAEYDRLSKEIDVSETTGNKKMDNFFKKVTANINNSADVLFKPAVKNRAIFNLTILYSMDTSSAKFNKM